MMCIGFMCSMCGFYRNDLVIYWLEGDGGDFEICDFYWDVYDSQVLSYIVENVYQVELLVEKNELQNVQNGIVGVQQIVFVFWFEFVNMNCFVIVGK